MWSFRALTLSLIVHFLVLLGLSLVPAPELKRRSPPTTFIEFAPENLTPAQRMELEKDRRVVRDAQVPEDQISEKERSARFLSAEDRTVLEEQRAAASGMTANRGGENQAAIPGLTEPQEQRSSQNATRQPPTPKSLDKLKPRPLPERLSSGDIAMGGLTRREERVQEAPDGSRPLKLPTFPGRSVAESGLSTVGEELPNDIRIGNFTALNTDRYLYYSFYARVEELVRHRWVKYVRSTLYSYQVTHPRAGNESWVTLVEIILDKQGNFIKGVIHDSSGLKGLDLAPLHAFKEAAKIPNPPVEMAKEDGLIHLQYQFNVHFVPQVAANP